MRTCSVARFRPLVASALVGLALGTSLLGPRVAHAQLGGCSTDPVLMLSNGTELDLSASINDTSDDVQQVTFTVHAPTNTSVIIYTPGALGPKEVVQFEADQQPGSYTTTTVVDTLTGGVAVTVQTQALAGGRVALRTVSGVSHERLSVALNL